MRAPMTFFETTPLGRIMNRFAKDIDTIDDTISESLRMLLTTFTNIMGSFVLIVIITPWFLIAIAVVMSVYCAFALYYRPSARELKRLDSILRSSLYAHFSESLVGLPTIRAYGETDRFRKESEDLVNIENRFIWKHCRMVHNVLTLLLQGLLADNHESTLAWYPGRYSQSPPDSGRIDPRHRRPALYLPLSDRRRAQSGHQHPAILRMGGSSHCRIGERHEFR